MSSKTETIASCRLGSEGPNRPTVGQPAATGAKSSIGGLELNPVSQGDAAEPSQVSTVSLGIDSGAAVTVIPRELARDYPVEATPESQSGRGYKIADGTTIQDEGKRRIAVSLMGGERRKAISKLHGEWK